MENNIIDFEKLFEVFLRKKAKQEPKMTPHAMEHKMAELYEEWKRTPEEKLGMKTPQQYIDEIKDPYYLTEILKYSSEKGYADEMLVEHMASVSECAPLLIKALKENVNTALSITCVELINGYDSEKPIELYLDILRNKETDDELKEVIIESLKEHAAEAAKYIFKILKDANRELKTILAEILIEAPKDERTYNLLIDLFTSGENIPLYSQYLGKYGDERSAMVLYRALDNCKYSDYIEIKNAIERMGGVVDDDRDFTDDETYIKIKNIRSN